MAHEPHTDKHIMITGGASGIGKLMAIEAASRGISVTVWDLDGQGAAAVADEIVARGGSAHSYGVDVTDVAAVRQAAQLTGPVDVVVNNAGIVTGKHLLAASEEQIRRTYDVNVLAAYWVTRAFLPDMLKRNSGMIVTVASAAGLVGVVKQTDYAASKFAAFGFAESLRAELRAQHSRVRSLVVCPYYIDTGMFAGVRTKFPALLPILRPEDVAAKVLDAIEKGRKQLILPPFVRLIPVVRALGPTAFDALMDFFGVNRTMDYFTGRSR